MISRHSMKLGQPGRRAFRPVIGMATAVVLVLLTAQIALVWGATERHVAKEGDFVLQLSADKAVYSLGETPTFTATIENRTTDEVYVVPALDGSTEGMRYPHVQFTVTRPKNATPLQGLMRCGNTNNISPKDFLRVAPKKSADILGWAGVHPQTFSDEGEYTVTLTYSTKAKNEQWYGFMGPITNKGAINKLLARVPSMELTSNTLSIRFRSKKPVSDAG